MTRKVSLRIALLFALFLGAVLSIYWVEFAPKHTLPTYKGQPLSTTQAVVFATLLALALATQTSLFLSNKDRLRVVLRPSIWRVLSAFLMTTLTPILVLNWMPWIAGAYGISGVMAGIVGYGQASDRLFIVIVTFGSAFILFAIWYPLSCLIISGVKNKILRVALFSLTWWGSYSAVLLVMGVQVFQL